MASEDHYLKARKALLVSSGLLALSMFVGISQKDLTSGSLLPFHLDNPGYIPHALAILVIYSLYNMTVNWAQFASENDQISDIQIRDFIVIIAIAVLALATFFIRALVKHLGIMLNDSYFSLTPYLISAGAVILTPIAIWTIRRYSKALTQRLSGEKKFVQTKLSLLLKELDWVLDFNPKASGARKSISFNEDGTIGQGANKNEHTWALNGNFLEIYKADGTLQNRFKVEAGGGEWASTNESEADAVRRGIKDQKILAADVQAHGAFSDALQDL